ncbi:MAG: LLM class flavin-dependent oxidoreductase, partial [Anaerolineales bacterium]|nr:LLM class flavin-dependent oxidoreductase [Anaerolineales bacterium]
MRFGIQLPTAKEGLNLPTPFFRPNDFLAIAQTAERLGYDSLWGNDHYAPQDYVRKMYATIPNFFEVLTVLTAIAAVTSRVELGSCVLVLPMRDIVLVAKQVATLDQLSGGRLLLGVGIGAYREEYAAARPDLLGKDRGAMLEEGLELLGRLLAEPAVTHRGKYYHVEALDVYPKPVRQPFPILVGGHQKAPLDRVVKYGRGWIPGWRPFEELKEWIALLREKAAAAGRDPQSIIVAPQFAGLIARTQEEAEERYMKSDMVQHRISLADTGRNPALAMENNLVGSPEVVLGKLEKLREFGVDH